MKIYSIPLILCFIISISSVSSQSEGSCVGKCGQGYVRADPCHCDYNCMTFMECCQDYKKVCTTEGSCKGRCHEGFIRGQTCDCDPGCIEIGKCCPDHKNYCVKPEKDLQPPPSPPDQPVRDEKDKPPEPTKKPDKVAEDVPEDRIQKDEAMPEKANKVPLDPSKATPKVAQPLKKTTKRSPRRQKRKKYNLIPGEDTQEPSQNRPTSSLSSPQTNREKRPRRQGKKKYRTLIHLEDDDEEPSENRQTSSLYYPQKNRKKRPRRPGKKKYRKLIHLEDDDDDDDDDEEPSENRQTSSLSYPPKNRKKRPRRPGKKKYRKLIHLEDDDDDEEPSQNRPTSSLSSPQKNRKKRPRRPGKKKYRKLIHLEDDDEDPYEGKATSSHHKKFSPKKNKKNTKYTTHKKPRKKKKKILVEYEDDQEDPNQKSSSPKDKKRPSKKSSKIPKKKKKVVESEEEIEESEENVASSSFSSSSSSSSVKGSKITKKLSRKNQKKNPTPKDKDKPKNPKTPKTKDGNDEPESHPEEPTSDGKDRIPRKPKEPGDDTKEPDVPPKDPTSDDNRGNPKKPTGTGDDPVDTDVSPKEPNQGDPDNDDKPRKTKTPKENESNDPEDTGNPPNEPNHKEKKKPKKTISLETEENIEEHTDVNSANTDENVSQSKQRTTRKRSPTNSKKKPKRPGDDTDDPSQNPSPSDKGKKKPNSKRPNKKKGKPTDGDDPSENPSPSDKGEKNPVSKEPNKKKGKPTDEDGDEPSKLGKGKNPKKKPNQKVNTKIKKKINSEDERQETVESEFSSSSQSSTSHTRSKSTRRLTGKNKKKPKDKKKIPDKPEDPLMPPKPKKDKGSPPTPVPTFKDEGSGDDGSGMDFLSTTTPRTTLMVHSTTTASLTTRETNQTERTVNPSKSPTKNPDVTSDNGISTTPNILPTKAEPEKNTNLMNASTQSPTAEDTTTGKGMTTDTPLQQMSTLKTLQDQSTTDSSDITHITVSGKLQETTNTLSFNSETVDPTKHTLPITYNGKYITSKQATGTWHSANAPSEFTDNPLDQSTGYFMAHTNIMPFSTTATTQKSEQAQTKETIAYSDITVITESTTRHSDHTTKTTTKEPSTEPQQKPTTELLATLTTEIPEDDSEISTIISTSKDRPTPTKSMIFQTTTLPTDKDDTEMSTMSMRPTKRPYPRGLPTNRPIEPEEMEHTKTTKPSTTNQYHVCDLLKDEAIKLRISDDDLQRITEICTEMQQQHPFVSTPSPDLKQPYTGDRNIPFTYPHVITPNWNQQPGTRIIQIVEEIYRRMNSSPMTNITVVHGYTVHKPSKWLLLVNKIKSSNDPQKNLCIGQPADGMTTLQNGSMVVFRGHHFWTLNQGGVMGCPRKITEVWGIPSPIDTVFTRCNCGGKTFFFKGSRYWRFTNDAMDQGYPKEIIKGFGGLRGKVTAVLPSAGFRTRPESVYFFKPGGTVQRYTFRQEQAKRCTKKKRPSIQYPIYSQTIQTIKYRFPRNVVRHRIQIHRTFSTVQQPLGVLHEQTSISSTWRGIPNNIISAVSLPNYKKQDGFDYYVFSKDKYYNINMSSKTAVKPPPGSEQQTSKDWYKCKE